MSARQTTLAVVVASILAGVGCFNEGGHNYEVSATRFEVVTGSPLLGARQLLVDQSNGDVWVLDGTAAPNAKWVLLSRGPKDVRKPKKTVVPKSPVVPEVLPPNDRS